MNSKLQTIFTVDKGYINPFGNISNCSLMLHHDFTILHVIHELDDVGIQDHIRIYNYWTIQKSLHVFTRLTMFPLIISVIFLEASLYEVQSNGNNFYHYFNIVICSDNDNDYL